MVTEQKILDAVQDCNTDRTSTFAEFIVKVFKGKFIEIYLGDSYEEVKTEQISTSYPSVFCGQVFAAYKECLVLKAVYVTDTDKTPVLGNMVFISERAIRGLNEIDGIGLMEDMFLRSKDSLAIKSIFIDGVPAKIRK